MSIEAICFDLDDTLFDYQQYARAGLEAAADRIERQTSHRYHEELLELYFEENHSEGTFDTLVERHGITSVDVDELVEAFHGAAGDLTPYPETTRTLGRLGETYQLGVITDGRGGHAKLRRLDLREYFESILVTPTIGCTKHDPVVFERVLSSLSVPSERAIYVGDDPRVDFRVPNELGMTTVRLRRGRYADLEADAQHAAAEHEIASLNELFTAAGLGEREQLSHV